MSNLELHFEGQNKRERQCMRIFFKIRYTNFGLRYKRFSLPVREMKSCFIDSDEWQVRGLCKCDIDSTHDLSPDERCSRSLFSFESFTSYWTLRDTASWIRCSFIPLVNFSVCSHNNSFFFFEVVRSKNAAFERIIWPRSRICTFRVCALSTVPH